MQLLEKIRNREKITGTHLNLNDIAVAQIAGRAGYDFVWIDMEHSYLSLEHLLGHIAAVQAGGAAAVVRVPQHDLTFTKKVLEMGPDGIVFPMVRSAKEANELIASTLYPPYGCRGFGPMNAVGYGQGSIDDYIGDPHNICRFIQIEHVDAVEQLDEIMQNEYIDGYIIGPNDLSGSIGELCQVFSPATTALIERAIAKLKAAGKYVGLSTGSESEEVIRHWSEMGVDMLSAASDFGLLYSGFTEVRARLDRAHKRRD